MLIDVLTEVGSKTGLDPVSQRTTLVALLNRAAKEMYVMLEANKIFKEVTLSVPPNKIITLPSYIGELRGMRTSESEVPFDLHGISSPRYTRLDVSYKWKNWRDLGESPVFQLPSAIAPLTLTSVAETVPITVNISGQTANAFRIEEKVVMSSSPQVTTNLFGPAIYNIACASEIRTSDITVTDAGGNVIAVLYNVDRQTRYKVIDVSLFPWPNDDASGNSLVDIAYKLPLRKYSVDSDLFLMTADYDNAWYYMAMHLYFQPLQNKPQDFSTFQPNAFAAMKASKEAGELEIEKKLSYGRNKFYNLTKPYYTTTPGTDTRNR